MDEELKRTVEAILFAAGRKLELSELAGLCKRSEEEVLAALSEWKALLDSANSPTMLVQDGSAWKLTVREKYVPVIKKVVTKTELPKGQLETLAVVAYKAPVLQSKVIKIRTNKAYEHLSLLEESGFITREKSGRTKLIKLTPKFFEYFDIDPSKLKNKFGSAVEIEKAIEAKEVEIESIEVEQRRQTEERLEKPQIVLGSSKEPLETYPALEPVKEMLPTGVELFMENFGNLEVYDVEGEKKVHKKHVKHKKKHEKKEKPEEKPEEPAESEAPEEEKPEELEVEEKPEEKPEVEEEKPAEEKPKKKKRGKKKAEKEPEAPEEEKPVETEVKETPAEPEELSYEQKIAKEAAEKTAAMKPKEFAGKGLFPEGVPPEVEAKIEDKIKKLLSGEKEE
ncbi:SMC-Scp complex subunit ScpB [Candidatus Woesearchaeota archaeon]|nr:SMC-Scp complex subunit ScpB [Candidatus Woesearchaeota archaeon]MBW3016593.1 SMC-Scp complex subunit ScpB [Candidatus Woesearchaeota archaeon]